MYLPQFNLLIGFFPPKSSNTKGYQNQWFSKWQVLGIFQTCNFGAPAILVPVRVVLWNPNGYQNRWFSKWQVLGIFQARHFGAPAGLVPVLSEGIKWGMEIMEWVSLGVSESSCCWECRYSVRMEKQPKDKVFGQDIFWDIRDHAWGCP